MSHVCQVVGIKKGTPQARKEMEVDGKYTIPHVSIGQQVFEPARSTVFPGITFSDRGEVYEIVETILRVDGMYVLKSYCLIQKPCEFLMGNIFSSDGTCHRMSEDYMKDLLKFLEEDHREWKFETSAGE